MGAYTDSELEALAEKCGDAYPVVNKVKKSEAKGRDKKTMKKCTSALQKSYLCSIGSVSDVRKCNEANEGSKWEKLKVAIGDSNDMQEMVAAVDACYAQVK